MGRNGGSEGGSKRREGALRMEGGGEEGRKERRWECKGRGWGRGERKKAEKEVGDTERNWDRFKLPGPPSSAYDRANAILYPLVSHNWAKLLPLRFSVVLGPRTPGWLCPRASSWLSRGDL